MKKENNNGLIIIGALILLVVLSQGDVKKEAIKGYESMVDCEEHREGDIEDGDLCVAPCLYITSSIRYCIEQCGSGGVGVSRDYHYFNSNSLSCQDRYDDSGSSACVMDCYYGGVPETNQVCEPNSWDCVECGNTYCERQCQSDGAGWKSSISCGADSACDFGTGRCKQAEIIPPGELNVDLTTLAGLKKDYASGQKVIFGIIFESTKTYTDIVLEAQTSPVGEPKKTSIQSIPIISNKCDILAGKTEDVLFRNEKVSINSGDSKLAQFEFLPPYNGWYDVYVDATTDCGVEPNLIKKTYIGSFLVSPTGDGTEPEPEQEEEICSTNSDCDVSECQECSNGYCISKCAGLLQKCESGECETNSFIIIVGAALLGIIMLGTLTKGKKK